MDAGRLLATIESIRTEYDKVGINNLFQEVVNTLNQLAGNPGDANFLAAFKTARDKLAKVLIDTGSNKFSPTQRIICEQINAEQFFGVGLRARFAAALSENSVTPQAASAAVSRVQAEAAAYMGSIAQAIKGLAALKVIADELKPGGVEIALSIPELNPQSGVRDLVKDLKGLDDALRAFAQITGSEIDSSQLKKIASNDWQFFLNSAPEIAACVVLSIERIVALYKTLLEIKKLKQDSENKNFPKEIIAGMQAHIDMQVKSGIDSAAKEIAEKYAAAGTPHGRQPAELEVLARSAITYFAARIDSGATVEVTVRPPNLPEKPAGAADSAENESRYKALLEKHQQIVTRYGELQEKGRALQALQRDPNPILAIQDTRNEER